jgi:hypothetical protein
MTASVTAESGIDGTVTPSPTWTATPTEEAAGTTSTATPTVTETAMPTQTPSPEATTEPTATSSPVPQGPEGDSESGSLLSSPWLWIGTGLVLTVAGLVLLFGLRRAG